MFSVVPYAGESGVTDYTVPDVDIRNDAVAEPSIWHF